MLKNTNYYLVCTIHRLEKEKLQNLQEDLTEITTLVSTNSEEFLPFIESLPIDSLQMQKETNIETSELADLKQEMIDQRTSLEMKIQELEMQKENLEKNIEREQREKIEIEKKMQKENDHLHHNNSQLQSELMKILKYKKQGIIQE
jgi:predicted  nucleic acid-binding Zn-ribbon protein